MSTLRIMTSNPKFVPLNTEKVTVTEVYDISKEPSDAGYILEKMETLCVGMREEPNHKKIKKLEAELAKKYGLDY